MQVTRINLTADASRGMPALGKDGTPAVFSDAVRVDLAECSLLFISGKTPVDENHKLVGSTMAEQTEQVLKNIKKGAGPRRRDLRRCRQGPRLHDQA